MQIVALRTHCAQCTPEKVTGGARVKKDARHAPGALTLTLQLVLLGYWQHGEISTSHQVLPLHQAAKHGVSWQTMNKLMNERFYFFVVTFTIFGRLFCEKCKFSTIISTRT